MIKNKTYYSLSIFLSCYLDPVLFKTKTFKSDDSQVYNIKQSTIPY